VLENIQAYEKPSQCQHDQDDKNYRHGMMSTGSCVVVIIITAQGYLLSRNSTMASTRSTIAVVISPISRQIILNGLATRPKEKRA